MLSAVFNHLMNSGFPYVLGLFGIAFMLAAYFIAEENEPTSLTDDAVAKTNCNKECKK